MAIRVKRIGKKDYMYFINWADGKRVETYCGSRARPESERRALQMEAEFLRERMAETAERLKEVEGRLAGTGERAAA